MRSNTSEEHAIAYHREHGAPRHCWMVVSPDARPKAEQLGDELRRQHVQFYPIALEDENQVGLAYQAVRAALLQAQAILGEQAVMVDITGGTKPMTAGAVLACLARGASMEYIVPIRHPDGTLDLKARPVPMKVSLREA